MSTHAVALFSLAIFGHGVIALGWWLQHRSCKRRVSRDRCRAFARWKARNTLATLSFGSAVSPANDVTVPARREAA